MPSPFPGMDPYLESRDEWLHAHGSLIVGIAAALNAVLPRRYQARASERTYIQEEIANGEDGRRRVIVPDVAVRTKTRQNGKISSRSPVVTLDCDDPELIVAVPEEERETHVEVVDVEDRSRLVAGIEILSHVNKRKGSGRKQYQKKQREMLRSKAHFLEVDLLRSGEHTSACPPPSKETFGSWDYLICLHRAGEEYRYEFWARTVRERLPRVKMPLLKDDEHVALDLQAVLNKCYVEGAFDRSLNYRRPPVPPLSAEDSAWSIELLKQRIQP